MGLVVSVVGWLAVDSPALAQRLRVVEGFGPESHTKARQSSPWQLSALTVSKQTAQISEGGYDKSRNIPVRTAVSPHRDALLSGSRNPRPSENGTSPFPPSSYLAPFRIAR